jgi:hypothetical protein
MSNRNKALWCGALLGVGLWMAPAGYAACNYSLSPTSSNRGHGATNGSFAVITDSNCTWTVSTADTWITIQPGWAGIGSNVVNYSVAANTNIVGRTGVIAVASQSFTIVQDPSPCNYSLSPSGRSPGYSGSSSFFDVLATGGCSWSVTNTNTWIQLTGVTSGSGNGNVTYTVGLNTTPVWRTGYLAVADQAFQMAQKPAPCIYELSPTNTTRGFAGAAGSVTVNITSGGTCSWFVDNTNSWITISNGSGIGTTNFGYIVASNTSSLSRTGMVYVWGQPFTIAQGGAPCNPSISPASATPTANADSRTVSLTLAGGCSWGVTNTNNWLTVIPTSGNGSATLTVNIDENPNTIGRTGAVSIAGQTYTVRQAAAVCAYKLSTTNRVHGPSATNNSITIDTLSVCSWTVTNTNSWLTFAVTNGVGDASIDYNVAANSGAADRTGYVTIADQQVFVTQHGVGCSISVSPATRPHGYSATENFVTITTGVGCTWNASTTNSWIILATNNGVGSVDGTNRLDYSILANPIAVPRTGYITVEDMTVTLNQAAAPCTNALVPDVVTNSPLDEIASVAVFGPAGCTLNITNTNSWITIISGAGGTAGDTNVIYEVATNITGSTRVGVVQIGSENFTIKQTGVSCNYKLSPAQRKHGPGTVTDYLTMTVSNPCPWIVINTNSWISITNLSGVGSNRVWYTVAPNDTIWERVGWIQVDGQFCVITQQASGCSYSLAPASTTHGHGAAANSFTINTVEGCPWMASTTNSWIALTGVTNGNTTSNIDYAVEANTNFTDRIGYIFADNQTFTITQRAAICSISISPSDRNHGYAGRVDTIDVSTAAGCSWFVDNTNTWITILTNASGMGTGTVTYAVSTNFGAARVGTFLIGGETFVITQAEYLCSFKFSPANRPHGFGQTNNSISILAGPTCSWSVENTNDWILITSPTSGVGNSNFTYTIFPNYGTTARTALIFMNDEVLTITQAAATNGLAIQSIIVGTGGDLTLKLNGGPPGIWEIQGSRNLSNWSPIGQATNTTGKVDFHIAPADATNTFYRAFLP